MDSISPPCRSNLANLPMALTVDSPRRFSLDGIDSVPLLSILQMLQILMLCVAPKSSSLSSRSSSSSPSSSSGSYFVGRLARFALFRLLFTELRFLPLSRQQHFRALFPPEPAQFHRKGHTPRIALRENTFYACFSLAENFPLLPNPDTSSTSHNKKRKICALFCFLRRAKTMHTVGSQREANATT